MSIGLTKKGKFKKIEQLNEKELNIFFTLIKKLKLDSLTYYKELIRLYNKNETTSDTSISE